MIRVTLLSRTSIGASGRVPSTNTLTVARRSRRQSPLFDAGYLPQRYGTHEFHFLAHRYAKPIAALRVGLISSGSVRAPWIETIETPCCRAGPTSSTTTMRSSCGKHAIDGCASWAMIAAT